MVWYTQNITSIKAWCGTHIQYLSTSTVRIYYSRQEQWKHRTCYESHRQAGRQAHRQTGLAVFTYTNKVEAGARVGVGVGVGPISCGVPRWVFGGMRGVGPARPSQVRGP